MLFLRPHEEHHIPSFPVMLVIRHRSVLVDTQTVQDGVYQDLLYQRLVSVKAAIAVYELEYYIRVRDFVEKYVREIGVGREAAFLSVGGAAWIEVGALRIV